MTLRKFSDDDLRRLVAAGKTRRQIRARERPRRT